VPLISKNLTIINQTNVYQRYPNLRNKILCQNMTDKAFFPTLEAADDATLPPSTFWKNGGVEGGLNNCSAMTFSWTTIRVRRDTAPYFITLSFWKSLAYNTTPFYKKSFQWPSNNEYWVKDPQSMPWQSEITLRLNEVGDDGVTRFNFRDDAFFPPPGEVFWISFYATMRYGKSSSLQTNAMYWVLLNNDAGSSIPEEIFMGGQPNSNFMYRDPVNFMRNGWVNWTDGLVVEDAMKITTSTHNLAFSLFFTCLATPPPPPTIPTTPPPTTTTNVSVQTESPSLVPGGNGTNMTEKEGTSGGRLVGAIVAPLLSLCLCGGCFAFLARRWYKRKYRRVSADDFNPTPPPVNPLAPTEVSLFDGIQDLPPKTPIIFSNDYNGMKRGGNFGMEDSSISSDD
jgi:hypothetical protein